MFRGLVPRSRLLLSNNVIRLLTTKEDKILSCIISDKKDENLHDKFNYHCETRLEMDNKLLKSIEKSLEMQDFFSKKSVEKVQALIKTNNILLETNKNLNNINQSLVFISINIAIAAVNIAFK